MTIEYKKGDLIEFLDFNSRDIEIRALYHGEKQIIIIYGGESEVIGTTTGSVCEAIWIAISWVKNDKAFFHKANFQINMS